MAGVGFHASHEQLAPSALLRAARRADEAGFDAVSCSDHIAPWGAAQGHSGFAWSWLGSALEATSATCGVVNAPVQRYHPAVIAQAIATLAEMYPSRFWAAFGSGEALNEHITGDRWPDKPTRDRRLLECVDVIKALLAGGERKPIYLQVHLSWDPDEATAEAVAHEQWRTNVFDSSLAWNLEVPDQFDAAAVHVTPADVRRSVNVSSDLAQHVAWLEEYVDLGVDSLYLHHVGQSQDAFIGAFAEHVLPALGTDGGSTR